MAIVPSKKSSAIVPVKKSSALVLARKSSAIVKADKFFDAKKEQKISQKTTRVDPCKVLKRIEKKVTKIDKILKDSLLFQKKENEKKRKEGVDKSFAEKEKEFEKKKPKQEKGPKLPSPPGLGLFDTIRNYIGNVIFGFFAVRLIDFLPTLLKVVPAIISVTDFITDLGGKFLNGLVTFVDWGYKAIDGTRQFVKQLGGEGLAKNFDMFAGAIDNLIEIAVIAALATADSGGDGGFGGDGGRPGRGGYRNGVRTGQYNGFNTRTTRSGTLLSRTGDALRAQRGDFSTSGYIKSEKDIMKRYFQRFGRDKFIQRFGQEGLESLPGGMARSGLAKFGRKAFVSVLGKGGAKAVLGFARPLLKRLPIIGALIDFGLSVALGEDPGRAAFKAIGAGLLGSVGAAVGSVVPIAGNLIGGIVGGMAGDAIGGALYDMFFGNKKPKQSKVKGVKAAGGGQASTRGGKTVSGPAKRTIKKTPVRIISVKPKEVNPGNSVGGKKNIEKIFPEASDSEKGKTVNPLEYMKSSSNKLSRTFGFGGLFSLITKAQLGDKPSKNDYQSAAQGLMAWMQNTFSSQILRTGGAFAEGGEVDSSMFNYDEDMKNAIAKSLQDSVAPKIDDTINDLMKQLGLKELDRGKKPGEGPGAEEEPTGSPNLVGNTNAEKVFKYLVEKEGFTPEAAAGIIGNLMQESGVNPKSRQLGGGPGRGMMQWTETERWASLSAWANNSGKDPWALETQVEWMIKEMKSYGTYNRIKGVSSYKKAVEIFESEMERAGTPNYPRRYQFAADALASFSGGAGGPGIALGKGYGGEGSKIAGELGKFIQQKLKSPQQFQAVTEHPQFGGVHNVHSKGSYHYSNRAIDIGAYADEQGPILQVIAQFNQMKGVKPVELLKAGDPGHDNHVHVAYEKGGKVGGLTKALLGEKGAEFVIDADSTRALEDKYPGFLSALNKADYAGTINVLKSYASYESGAETVVMAPDDDQEQSQNAPSGQQPVMIGGGGSVNSDMQFEDSLMYG